MAEKQETMQEVYNKLNSSNQDIMLLMAKGMEIAQKTESAPKTSL